LHAALDHFEDRIGYHFKNRSLLQVRILNQPSMTLAFARQEEFDANQYQFFCQFCALTS
jgi:hypothetical protein